MRIGSRVILIIVLCFVGVWAFRHAADLEQAYRLFRQITVFALLVLFVMQGLYTICLGASNQAVYEAVGTSTSLFEQVLLILSSGVANRLIPSGGVAGITSFCYLAGKRGIPLRNSIHMTAVSTLLGYIQTIPVAGLLLLCTLPSITLLLGFTDTLALPGLGYMRVVSAFALAVALGTLVLVWLSSREGWQRRIRNLHINRPFLRVIRDGLLKAGNYASWCITHKNELVAPLVFLLLLFPIRILMLQQCFSVFHYHMPLISVIIGYTFALLISVVSFLPTNLGVFEASLIGIYHSFGVPIDVATAVTLLYRIYTFWLPNPVGIMSYIYMIGNSKHISG